MNIVVVFAFLYDNGRMEKLWHGRYIYDIEKK